MSQTSAWLSTCPVERNSPIFCFPRASLLNTMLCEKFIYNRHDNTISLECKRDNGQNHPRRRQAASATKAASSSSIRTLQNSASLKVDAKVYHKTDSKIWFQYNQKIWSNSWCRGGSRASTAPAVLGLECV